MGWGDTFKKAWNVASDTAKGAAGAIATGVKKAADWTKDKAKQASDWVKKKSDEVSNWVKQKIDQGVAWAKETGRKIADKVKSAYNKVKKVFNEQVVGRIKQICIQPETDTQTPCVKAKENDDILAKSSAETIKKFTGKEVDATATEKLSSEDQPYMTSSNISKCKSKAYQLENNGVMRRFNRYRNALPYARWLSKKELILI